MPQPTEIQVLSELGSRIARRRLDRELTQAEVAREAGVGKATVERLEAGQSVQLASLLRIFRALDLLGLFYDLLPASGPTPMELLHLKGKARQRAPGSRGGKKDAGKKWDWGDDA